MEQLSPERVSAAVAEIDGYCSMKRCLLYLPLLGLAPLGYFLGSYLEGTGILPGGVGFLTSAASMFILPGLVSALVLAIPNTKAGIRTSLFFCSLVAQAVLLGTDVPAAATSEMMGIAHRFRREFPPDQVRDCAALILQKHRDRAFGLKVGDRAQSFLVSESAIIVEDAELPASLRGRFKGVFIQQGSAAGGEQVVFALGERTGIICDGRKRVSEFFVYSMAEGVHVYRYQRL